MTMDTKALLAEAEALKTQLLTDRRTLHRDPEVGPSLPRTAAYVTERLTALGYTPRPLAGGVVADITGEDTGRCVLLRADMDHGAHRPPLPRGKRRHARLRPRYARRHAVRRRRFTQAASGGLEGYGAAGVPAG